MLLSRDLRIFLLPGSSSRCVRGVFTINHTYVDDRMRGRGIASELVRRAVEEIERRGGRVEATCSYALLWLARNRGCEITSPLSCPIP